MGMIVENLLDLIENSGEYEIEEELSAFSCMYNEEVENFLKYKAISFAKQKLSITYLISDETDGALVAYFTLAVKAVEIKKNSVSKTLNRRISKYSLYNDKNETYTAVSFLLAQIGKNFAIDNGSRITGEIMMQYAERTIQKIQRMIGVGLVYLEVEKDNKTAIDLYTNRNHYIKFDERKSISDGKEYNVMIKGI
ncbi:MAG: hypothetical protein II969_14750 [Anaerolineaceae bacterium]|nr:hypothetical protein [Anaerolineaceae bacterium]